MSQLETQISIAKEKKARQIIELLPADITFDQMKFFYIDKVINHNKGNLTAASMELRIPYRTLLDWISKEKVKAKSRGKRSLKNIELVIEDA